MRILHAGRFQLGSVHGTHHALWQLAVAQAQAGHVVTIANLGWEVPDADVVEASRHGVRLVGVPVGRALAPWIDPAGRMRDLVARVAPDVAHLQYVRVPEALPFARVLRAARVPYVVSLHGGMKPAEMVRHRWRKLAWWRLLERRVHARAAGVHFVTKRERDEYRATCAVTRPADAVVANVVDPEGAIPSWKGAVSADAPLLVTLGRYDIWHKGLDKAAAMTRGLQRDGIAARLRLHGSPVGRFAAAMDDLSREYADLPLEDGGVVSGNDKFAALAAADLYVQYSRFELFGMALVEALRVGTPVALSEECDLAPALSAAGAALVLPMDPAAAARTVAAALRDPDALAAMAARGHAWWKAHCRGRVVVDAMDAMYRRAIGAGRRPGFASERAPRIAGSLVVVPPATKARSPARGAAAF